MNQRREILGALGAMGLSLALPGCGGGGDGQSLAQLDARISHKDLRPVVLPDTGLNKFNVVVVGGGMAGATTAKYLRLWGGTGLNVTLIEPESSYTTNISSNLVLANRRQISDLQFQYNRLRDAAPRGYGVDVRQGTVTSITTTPGSGFNGSVNVNLTAGGTIVLPYHRLVLAPGIDFDVIPGLNTAEDLRVPHAYRAGVQTTTLRDQLTAMRQGGTFIITIPPTPFRAATAPYERACIVADFFMRNNPTAKILVLDANSGFAAGAATFGAAFAASGPFGGMITRVPSALVTAINPGANPIVVNTDVGPVGSPKTPRTDSGDVVNVIPPQRAAKIVVQAGLVPTGRFAPVDVLSYESTIPGKQFIHVVGDSSGSTQPKGGHISNQQGKVCANAIVRLLNDGVLASLPAPATATVAFSPIAGDTATWFTTVFKYREANPTAMPPVLAGMVAAPAGVESANPTDKNFEQLFKWFGELHADTLG